MARFSYSPRSFVRVAQHIAGRFAILPVMALLAVAAVPAPTTIGNSSASSSVSDFQSAKTIPAGENSTASSYYPEVRLRKLHLVRPDLIPYPIAYEVYC